MNSLDIFENNLVTGKYVFPVLEDPKYFWKVKNEGYLEGRISLKISLMKKEWFFTRTVDSAGLGKEGTFTPDGFRFYEPGELIQYVATEIRYRVFRNTFDTLIRPENVVEENLRGRDFQKIMKAIYVANEGTHQGGGNIFHYEEP